ncbi:hypothetical protein FOYG_11894 [Fusarium oxysporum NRRL 32931]|uniref:Major facilitator superfamily (MFS) profile domain-containing protein n=1 Tax=Fusarium oxysporum NRRL 32931 TaxID=660029 RepID=W9HU00_FUSOX|nr:hypothetical protein FOYG_11894 [Fusarium oxysporum NRRL 32931]
MDREKINETSLRKASILEGEAIIPRLKPRIIFIIVFLGFGSASMGYASSIIATTLSQPSWYATIKLGATSDMTALIGATNGGFYAGGTFGSIFSGYFAHRYGRKKSAAFAALIILISSALITASYHIAMFITFRVFQGWGSFQMLSTIPMWMAELVPPHRRGMLVPLTIRPYQSVDVIASPEIGILSSFGLSTFSMAHNVFPGLRIAETKFIGGDTNDIAIDLVQVVYFLVTSAGSPCQGERYLCHRP